LKQSKLVTVGFILVTVLVAAAIIWQACSFVDGLQNNLQATKKIHLHSDNKVPERGRFDAVSSQFSDQIESMTSDQPYGTKAKVYHLQGSEILFDKALANSRKSNYSESANDLSTVLQLIPMEAKSRQTWFADGKNRDERMFTAMTFQLRSFCLLQKGKYRDGIKDLDRAISLRPAYGGNYTNRGRALILLGEKARGQADLNHARELPAAPDDTIADEHALDDLVRHD